MCDASKWRRLRVSVNSGAGATKSHSMGGNRPRVYTTCNSPCTRLPNGLLSNDRESRSAFLVKDLYPTRSLWSSKTMKKTLRIGWNFIQVSDVNIIPCAVRRSVRKASKEEEEEKYSIEEWLTCDATRLTTGVGLDAGLVQHTKSSDAGDRTSPAGANIVHRLLQPTPSNSLAVICGRSQLGGQKGTTWMAGNSIASENIEKKERM